ncbi:twin-arginine translocase TatA/TatE family subunit [Psychromonas algicola]|uniref:twin-arginine translocase TatA/TatE family subunit n=1 Tax=Psychromonas algicola TaxID=2555642 RepID=UPI0010681C5F|nr:twin-arginine translocase TatA/TatE family subunit [Psychromonas sp. RZ5]TEW52004.1 twin-arginine translocase TatA/TatE family subunit [Psychromonas sp. RZ5]
MGGIGIWQLVIIAVIVIVLFGTKKLRGVGSDLGGAIKGFKKAIKDEEPTSELEKKPSASLNAEQQVADAEKSQQKD